MDTDKVLAKSAQSIQNALSQQGLSFKVIELSASTRTAEEAAATLKCDVAQIVKSLIFKTKTTHKPILVLASGSKRVNEKTIEGYVEEKITKADADFTRQVTGFAIGGIPPMGHTQPLDTFIDEDLLAFEEIWAAAGTPRAVFSLRGVDLPPLTKGRVVSVK